MTVEANPSSPRVRANALSLAGAAFALALMASSAFAGCGWTGVSSGIKPPLSPSAGIHTGSTPHSGSTSRVSACATGISNATRLGAGVVHVSGGAAGGSRAPGHVLRVTHQNFNFQGKPVLSTGSHRHAS